MSTAGIFNSSNFSPVAAPRSFAEGILMKMPNGTAPLFALSSRLKKVVVKSHVHTFMSKDWQYPHLVLTSSLPSATPGSVSTLSVQSTNLVIPNQIFQVASGEQLRVVSVQSDTTLTVARGVGGFISATPLPAGTEMYHIGNAHEEASLRPQPTRTTGYEMHNHTQIFRNTWAISGTVAAEMVEIGEHPIIADKKEAAMTHATEIEKSLFFAKKYSGVLNGQPFRIMSGLLEFIQTYAPNNVTIAGTQTSYNQLEEMLDPAFNVVTDKTNSNDRVLFVGNVARKVINRLGREFGQIQMQMGETSFGMRFERFKTYRGEFVLVEHPLFNTNPEWAKMAIAVDLSSLSVGYLQGRDTQHKPFNSKVNSDAGADDHGIDAEGGTFLSELTLEVRCPEAHAVIYGLCEAACEPCKVLVDSYHASFFVSHPCSMGEVPPGTVVTLSIAGGAPNTTVPILTSTGVVNITLDAQGNGSATYTVGTEPTYYFHVVQTVANNNTIFNNAMQAVCVQQPCTAQPICNDDPCPPQVNPQDFVPDTVNCVVGSPDAHIIRVRKS